MRMRTCNMRTGRGGGGARRARAHHLCRRAASAEKVAQAAYNLEGRPRFSLKFAPLLSQVEKDARIQTADENYWHVPNAQAKDEGGDPGCGSTNRW